MQIMYRILIVAIIILAMLFVSIDYIGFHGSIMLGQVANGAAVSAIDTFLKLFEGPHAFTNFMFVAVISIGLLVAALAIFYKFIKG